MATKGTTMKRIMAFLLIGLLATGARAAYVDTVATNIPNYVFIPSGLLATNTMTSLGMSSNIAYVCIPATNFTYLTEATAVSSYRSVVFGFVKSAYARITVLTAATNQPSRLKMVEGVRPTTDGDVKFTYSVETDVDVSTAGVVDE